MKKIFFRSILFVSLISFLVTPVLAFTEENPLVINLIAGQHITAGKMSIWDDGESLFVSYNTNTPWCLTETHLAVVPSFGEIPQANGNPIPGRFPYKNSHGCSSNYLYKIPLDKNVCDLYIAAHAVVKSPGGTETAWGSGYDFPGNNWATYFLYKTNKCSVTPSPTSSPTVEPSATVTNTPSGTPSTNTPTPTATGTAPVCQPAVVNADYSKVLLGQSVEGMGVVAPGLNIDGKGTAVKILPDVSPNIYRATGSGGNFTNGGISPQGGFSDLNTKLAEEAHLYTFTFAPGTTVSNFSLHMLDFGDLNPSLATNHQITMTAYGLNDVVISTQELSYTSTAERAPSNSDLYGNLIISGDALGATVGQPGNWSWSVSGNGIVRVVLTFDEGYDPAIGFDTLTFTTECSQQAISLQPLVNPQQIGEKKGRHAPR